MTEAEERSSVPDPEDPAENPTDEELDVEGPNESAPGREPSDVAEGGDESAPPASGG